MDRALKFLIWLDHIQNVHTSNKEAMDRAINIIIEYKC